MKKAKSTEPQKGRTFDSIAQAAAALGMAKEELQRLKAAGCTAFRGARVVESELLDYIANSPAPAQPEPGAVNLALEEALKMRADRMLKEHRLDEAKRRVIPADEMRRTFTRSILAAKSFITASETATAMKARMRMGLSDEQVQRLTEILAEEHREIFLKMASGEWLQTACPHCAKTL